MKKFFSFLMLLCIAASLSALDFFPPIGGFFGLGPEINGHSRESFALGGGLIFGMDLNEHFSAGLKTSYFHNLNTVSALELNLFFRYYLPWLRLPKETDGPFAQAELGSVFLFETGYYEYAEAAPAFSGGVAIGWRFNLGKNWFIDPAIRIGYPHIWGIGVTAGFKIRRPSEKIVEYRDREVIVKEEIIIPESIEEEDDDEEDDEDNFPEHLEISLRIQESSIFFRPDHADFEGLSEEILAINESAFDRAAAIINSMHNYKVIIEGYANPTTAPGPARDKENEELQLLSEQRAQKVIEELEKRGVDPSRLTAVGYGGARTVYPYTDRVNNWQNRRVEFILIR